MSYYSDASLVMIPSGVKDGTVFSQKPLSSDGQLTFSRGSDIEATRVNANGYIEKAQVNILLQSNTFSTTWVNSTSTETGGQAGYDGTNDAWLLETTGANGRLNQNVTASLCTLSVYAKAGTVDFLRFQIVGPSDANAYFDLSNGTIGTTGADAIATTITSIGGGWYRCSMSTTSCTTVRIFPAQADNDTSGTSGNIYIQDAQLNYGLVAQTYQETTTAAVVSGITDNMPRLNYDPANPTCPSLLLEPSRTNLIENSEYIASAGWSPTLVNVTQNYGTSPEGVTNSSLFELTSVTSGRMAESLSGLTDGTTYTFSCYYKGTAGEVVAMRGLGSGGSGTDVVKTITLTGDWQREDLQFVAGSTSNVVYIVDSREITNPSEATTFEVYGAQLEAGNFVSSYIPSYGSSATRTSDIASKTGVASLIGQTEGTIFIQVESNEHISELSDGTTNNRIVLYTDGNDYVRNLIRSGGSMSSNIQTNTTIQAGDKIALAYANNDSVIYKNGVQIGSDTTVTIPATSKVNVGSDFSGNLTSINSVNQFILFPTRLTNAQLAELTA